MNRSVPIGLGLVWLAAAAGVMAGPLKRAEVSAEAKWVVHVDLEAGWASGLGRYVKDHNTQFKLDRMRSFKEEMGLDPFEDVRGVTIYGVGDDHHDFVTVVHTTPAIETFLARVREKEKGLATVELGGRTVYTWDEGGASRYGEVRGEGAERTVIVAPGKEQLLAGVAVLDGKAASLGGERGGGVLGGAAPRFGSIIFAVANRLPEARAMAFKNAKSFVLDFGQNGDEVYGDLTVDAGSTENAQNIRGVMQMAVGFATIGAANEPRLQGLAGLASSLVISGEEGTVTVKFRCAGDKLGAALKSTVEDEGKGRPEDDGERDKH